ncbi:hypothetical protein GCM10020295_26020 [Streptomyces cinereospinus]
MHDRAMTQGLLDSDAPPSERPYAGQAPPPNARTAVCEAIGFADAKVSDITRVAGIAKGTFHLHVGSRTRGRRPMSLRYPGRFRPLWSARNRTM